MVIEVLRPLRVHLRDRTVDLRPGQLTELNDEEAVRLLEKKPDAVRPVLCPGDIVEWLTPALPKQRGEVLEVYQDGIFEVFHPVTEKICRLPVRWIIRVVTRSNRWHQGVRDWVVTTVKERPDGQIQSSSQPPDINRP
jgi:hypothetical protein